MAAKIASLAADIGVRIKCYFVSRAIFTASILIVFFNTDVADSLMAKAFDNDYAMRRRN